MNTARLKVFSQDARKILLDGVQNALLFWGFDLEGNTHEKPESIPGGCLFRGEVYNDTGLLNKWYNLSHYIHRHTAKDAIEQASYTWFNRLMAISILEHNSLSKPVLVISEGHFDPPLLADAKQGKMSFLSPSDQEKVKTLILEHNDEKAFGILLVGYCRSNALLNRVFGSIDDFTELLLPGNLLSPGGILHLINNSGSVSDDEYKEVELIGWLYQFYISDKKDEVFLGFKKNIKARSEDIPAATQIFTPRWIVNYMVENTVGKIWLDHSPDSALPGEMKYLVENNNKVTNDLISSAADLKLLDPSVGSGHILVVGFDLLIKIYREEGYTTKTAVREILKNNLFGIDIDLRATQLARFAILIKAASYDADILSEDILPSVFAMPETDDFNRAEILAFLGSTGEKYFTDLSDALILLKQGKNIGSALKFAISDETRQFLNKHLNDLNKNLAQQDIQFLSLFIRIKPFIEVLLILTDSYEAVVTNPPYMGQKSMNGELKDYINSNYPISKSDLFAVFMEVLPSKTKESGRFALINLPSWPFISSFEGIREMYIRRFYIESFLHMGRGIFGIDFGSVSFCVKKENFQDRNGNYFRLHDRNFQHIYYSDIEKLFLFSKNNPNYRYDFSAYRDEDGTTEIPEQGMLSGLKLFYPKIPQSNFLKIPSSPLAYWVSNKVLELYKQSKFLKEFGSFRRGIGTSDNNRFLRFWYEVDLHLTNIFNSNAKWIKYNKGGDYQKWYGNRFYLVNWENDGYEIKNLRDEQGNLMSRPQNTNYNFLPVISYSSISSGTISLRIYEEGFINDQAGNFFYIKDDTILKSILGLLNTKISNFFIKLSNPTLNITVEDLNNIIYNVKWDCTEQILLVDQMINLTKKMYDQKEISWDFKNFILVNNTTNYLNQSYDYWLKQASFDFFQLHKFEEKLNELFIDLYGLQDELNSEIKLKDITLLQDELDYSSLELINQPYKGKLLPVRKEIVIQQLVSYILGCVMGRYRLDKPGLNIAHPNPSIEETAFYKYNSYTIEIDQDAIIPILGEESPFSDDLNQKVRHLVEAIWGEKTLTENINFIEDALGLPLDKYLTQKFWDFHFKMYKKTPIYWLFESPKGYFKVLAYMHRMDKFTVQKIRLNYLHRYMEHLSSEIYRLRQNGNNLRKLDILEDALQDCRTYSDILKPLADKQITFDLDDGVKYNYKLFEGAVKPI
jgi:hypothetical protein